MVIGSCGQADDQEVESPAQDLESRAAEVRRMYELGQWEALAPAAASLLEELRPGSPDWFAVSSFIVASAQARWDTETLERVARAALSQEFSMQARELMERRRSRSGSPSSPRLSVPSPDPDPLTARSLMGINLRLAYLFQHHGQHE